MTEITTTPDGIAALAERLTEAITTTRALADAEATADENPTQLSIRMIRMDGKVQGLKAALDLLEEIQRANPACPSRTGGNLDKVPCLLGEGHDGWHKSMGAVWSG